MSQLAAFSDLIGDLALYRDLSPVDARLPRFDEAWPAMGLAGPVRPRKQEPNYAVAVAWLLHQARALDRPGVALRELVYVGDTMLSDGGAFHNLVAHTGWRGWGFIGGQRLAAGELKLEDGLHLAGAWSALAAFARLLVDEGAQLDAGTALVVDVDKTALGARGRNDKSIDASRLAAMTATVAEALGPAYDEAAFMAAYNELNVVRYHPFTGDNQDYLAYICLVVSAHVITVAELVAQVQSGAVASVPDLARQLAPAVLAHPGEGLHAAHAEFVALSEAGDPTPYKAFRRREYMETVTRMGCDDRTEAPEARLHYEICLTREVMDFVAWLSRRGCLVLALSDKPDEASLPTAGLAAAGYLPLHRTRTHVVGEPLNGRLPG